MSDPKPAAPGPQIGAPPSLEQVPVDRLKVDPVYQRATDGKSSRRLIARMHKRWNWQLCLPLVVSRRADGDLMVIDGQHRHLGASSRGDVPFLPCVIYSGLTLAEEAQLFVDLNTEPQRLSQADIFVGMLATGENNAVATAALLEETGWRLVRHNNTAAWNPGDIHCAPMIARARRRYGEVTVRTALRILRQAWPDTPVTCSARLLEALFVIVGTGAEDPDERAAQDSSLVATLASQQPSHWLLLGADVQKRSPHLSRAVALVRAILGRTKPEPARPTPPPMPKVVRAPAPEPKASPAGSDQFGATGKGWCDQCEQLVSRDRASACRSQFCRMNARNAA